jgi:FMN phosphatase YigB (HAD superfamily)
MINSRSEKLVILDFDDTCFNAQAFKDDINSYFYSLIDEAWKNTELKDLPRIARFSMPNGLDQKQLKDYLKQTAQMYLIKQAYEILKYEKINYTLEEHFKRILDLLEFSSDKTAAFELQFKEDLENELIFKICDGLIFPDTRDFMQKCIQDDYRLIILTQGDPEFQKNKIDHCDLPDHQLIISKGPDKIEELKKILATENLNLNNDVEAIYIDDKDKYLADFHRELPYGFAVIMNREGVNSPENIIKVDDPNLENLQVVNNFNQLSTLLNEIYKQMESQRKLYHFLNSVRFK